ncbi:MAG TPA: hypothetical protein VF212_00870 [Longimicrobiales bacterium]
MEQDPAIRGGARRGRIVLALAAAVAVGLVPARARAQATPAGELVLIGANALLGGLTSGVAAWLKGGSFLDGLGGGAAGGSVQYLGKRLSTSSLPGAGLAGGVVGAAGASMVRNGAAGRGLLDRLIVPIGPIVVDWVTVPDSGGVSARLHVGRAIFLGRLIVNDELELDGGETISAGSPVFQARGRVIEGEAGRGVGGLELWGAVALSDRGLLPPIDGGALLAHERVHLVQDAFLNIAWADPVEDWLLRRIPYGDVVTRYVDFGGIYMVIAGLLIVALPYEDRPWEDEAAYMETGW